MKKLIAGALAAITMAAVTIPTAEARPYRGDRHYSYDNHRRGNGDAVAAGIAGLAIGALIGSAASQPRGYYEPRRDYYGPAPRAYYEPRYCSARDLAWDPYLRRNVVVERSYPC